MYTLLDGIKQHQENPDTFQIPSANEINALQPGDHVKLCFEEGKRSERMWVNISKINGDNYEGTLDNDPFFLMTIVCGDKVMFNSKHIINTL